MKNLIEFIDIKGFQSQYDTRIDFAPGMTALTGLSMEGKTAILRAFEFVRRNRPSGLKFGYRYEDMITSVAIGINGHIITHKKAKTALNKEGHKALYIIEYPNGEETEFSAYGASVPDPVTDLLNISDIAIQSQLDPYMLVLSTAGQIATTINKITGIDVSDRWLKEIRKTLTTLNAEKAILEKTNKGLSKEILRMAWVDEFKKDVEKAEELNWKYEKVLRDANAILDLVNVNSAALSKIGAIKAQLIGLQDIIKAVSQVDDKVAEINTRNAMCKQYLDSSWLHKVNLGHYEAIYPDISLFDTVTREIEKVKSDIEFNDFYWNQNLMADTCREELEIEKDNLATILTDSGKCFLCGSELTDWGLIRENI